MLQVQLEEFLLTVDEDTAKQLEDPSYAKRYLETIRASTASTSLKTVTLWKSAKCPTSEDHEATLSLLALRKQLDGEFKDKKTPKNDLWQRIAKTLNEQGFFVGEGVEGREKVRQKFANLYSSYIKFCDAKKRTGEGRLKTPKYYEEMEDILGDKHKVKPVLIIDSSTSPSEAQHTESETSVVDDEVEDATNCVESDNSISVTPKSHCFDHVKKTVKPRAAKESALEELVRIQKENQITRKEEFETLLTMCEEQNRQRHEQMMALIANIAKLRKRKFREADFSDSD